MIKKIPELFYYNGFEYKLIKKVGQVVLYQQSKEGCLYGYEIHKLRIKPARTAKFKQPDGTIQYVKQPKREEWAGTSEFGTRGWSTSNIEHGKEIFQEQLSKSKR
jgi:hypothetical protein